ncbi:hypothetical protein K3495_g3367 [Podosphaera aphanis]|nr:hypothetical protein K3495_g3367 [Podosphaera aphanis]
MRPKTILQSLRKALRSAGVDVKKDEVVVWDTLAEMIGTTKLPPWTEEQTKKSLRYKSFEFTSGKIPWQLENNFGIQDSNATLESAKTPYKRYKREISESPKTQTPPILEKQPLYQQSNFLSDIARQSGNLSKIYTEDMKYSGETIVFSISS